MNPWINYHHLFYFKTIAEMGSISRAAEKLSLGQPTLSAQLKQFEENIGVKLFHRQHKKLILSEQGKVAFEYAKNIFNLGSEMYDVLHERLTPFKQTLHIGALDSISKGIVTNLTEHALTISPCQITLSEGSPNQLLRELTGHKMDIIITNSLPTGINARGISSKKIAQNNIALFGAPKFKQYKKNFPQSITGIPLVVPSYDSGLRPDLDHWARLNDIELNIIVESQDIAVKIEMATKGLGLIAAAPHSVDKQVKSKKLIEIGKLKGVLEEIYLLIAKRKVNNQLSMALYRNFSI